MKSFNVSSFIANIFLFIISISLVLFLCRLIFIIDAGYIGGAWTHSVTGAELKDLASALFNGLRYDSRTIAGVSLFYIFLYFAFSWTPKRPLILSIFAMVFVFLAVAAAVGDEAFYKIFGDTYNVLLLGLIYDDLEAILKTAVSGEYNAIFRVSVMIFSSAVFGHFYYKFVKMADKVKERRPAFYIPVFLVFAYLVVLMMTSDWKLKGGSIDYMITPAKNDFLRKATPGALRDLHLVYIAYSNMQGLNFQKFSEGASPRQAAEIYFGENLPEGSIDLNALIMRKVETGTDEKIDHIFVIIAESLSSWHFDKEFDPIGLASSLKALAASPDGKMMGVFIENAEGTIGAVDVMLTGLYNTGAPISDRTGSLDVFSSSCAVFKDLGYENRFFYFGSPAWRKLDRYVLSQGFDKIYSIADMDAENRGVWGVPDDEGFRFVTAKTEEAGDRQTFNMILTTMYHPPYNMPLNELGVPVDDISVLLDELYPSEDRSHETTANIMGHAYLANRMLADFIREITEKYPNSIVFLTGDHFDRMYPSKIRTSRQKYGVPFIVYGKNINKAKFVEGAGSQIDIIPTVMELAAPAGFVYHAFGQPLMSLDDKMDVDHKRAALGLEAVATERFVADRSNIEYFENAEKEDMDREMAGKELRRERMGRALSWWIINKGHLIEDGDK